MAHKMKAVLEKWTQICQMSFGEKDFVLLGPEMEHAGPTATNDPSRSTRVLHLRAAAPDGPVGGCLTHTVYTAAQPGHVAFVLLHRVERTCRTGLL